MNHFQEIEKEITRFVFKIISREFERPWGGFLVINESQAQDFANKFFDGLNIDSLKIGGKLSPKILIVNPKSRLSWQYHFRRKEIWRILKNKVGIIRSMNDNENEMEIFKEDDVIHFQKEERHRLIGLSDFGIVAEIWIHTETDNPSDEDDIVRLQDDYSRA